MHKTLKILGWSATILLCAGLATWITFSLLEPFNIGGTAGALLSVLLAMPIAAVLFSLCVALLRRARRARGPQG